jgi:hypothetical protein
MNPKRAILILVLAGICIATAIGHPGGVLDDLGYFERVRQAQQGTIKINVTLTQLMELHAVEAQSVTKKSHLIG